MFVAVDSVRAIAPEELADLAGGGEVAASAEAALGMVNDDARVLVCGSLFLAGEVLGLVEGGEFEASAQ